MTPQEILNTSYLGVMKQGAKSIDRYGKCRYRGNKGMKCGVGFLLSDKACRAFDRVCYKSTLKHIVQGKSKYVEEWMLDNILLLDDIQRAHDESFSYSFMESIAERYSEIATKYNLTLPNVDVNTGGLQDG